MLALEFFIYNRSTGKYVRKGDWRALELDKAAINLLDLWPHGKLSLDEAKSELMQLKEFGLDAIQLQREKQLKNPKKDYLDWSQVYEDLRSSFRLAFFIGQNRKRHVYVVNELKEVESVKYESNKDIYEALYGTPEIWSALKSYYATSPHLEAHKLKMSFTRFVQTLIDDWLMNDELLRIDSEPVNISWSTDEYAFKKLDPQLLVPGPTPTWDEFTSRLDHPELFMAWVWSIIEPTNTVRQACWIRGGGQDGKSAVQRAIEHALGLGHSYSAKRQDLDNTFFLGSVYGKTLVTFPDCRYLNLLKHDYIKMITGGDSASIEKKGEQSKSGVLKAKLLVHSNFAPTINPESRFQTSRLLCLKLQQTDTRDAMFEERLKTEVWHFLANCEAMFDKHVNPGKDNINIPPEIFAEMMNACSSKSYRHMKLFEMQHIDYGVDYEVDYSRVNERLLDFRDVNGLTKDQHHFMTEDFEEVMRERGIDTCKHMKVGNDIVVGYKGFRLKDKK
jgi:hypothetical protein